RVRAEPLDGEDRVRERRYVRERLARDAERAHVDGVAALAPRAAAVASGDEKPKEAELPEARDDARRIVERGVVVAELVALPSELAVSIVEEHRQRGPRRPHLALGLSAVVGHRSPLPSLLPLL